MTEQLRLTAEDFDVAVRQIPLAAALRKATAPIVPAQATSAGPRGWARFSPCLRYRYLLGRKLRHEGREEPLPRGFVCALNPSRAGAEKDDPTIGSLSQRAIGWGWGAYEIGNPFAFITSDPADLLGVKDPIGPENDAYLFAAARAADVRVVAWGAWGPCTTRPELKERLAFVLGQFRAMGPVYCIGLTKDGHPLHPSARNRTRVPENSPLVLFAKKGGMAA